MSNIKNKSGNGRIDKLKERLAKHMTDLAEGVFADIKAFKEFLGADRVDHKKIREYLIVAKKKRAAKYKRLTTAGEKIIKLQGSNND